MKSTEDAEGTEDAGAEGTKDAAGAGAGAGAGADAEDAAGAAGAGAGAELTARFVAEVDWTKVVDPSIPVPAGQYGPDLLERLWSPDLSTAHNAADNLYFVCSGNGGSVTPAAPEVLPFLVEAVRDSAVAARVRLQLLETLGVLARAGNDARAAGSGPTSGGWWRTAPAAWPAAWELAVDALLPLLADDEEGDEDVRGEVAAVLARATHRADELIVRFLARFEDEPHLSAAEQLVRAVGELAPHAVERREDAVVWLRQRATDAGKGEEPDVDDDIDAWLAWMEQHGHDVRPAAVVALRRALRPL
ncbi:SUKH-3 domain-containing protein [Streptomyces sp. CS057]|uniref:SUKH-3 domain-containing protein n=1 Tax=Streptomyces sp. CS057 TaxID=1982764 RepID=UPI00211B520D|nr:SUKH-3 domain-containing protein [Streptomyces sp. CS057]